MIDTIPTTKNIRKPTMFKSILLGVVMTMCTVLIHAMGTMLWVKYLKRLGKNTPQPAPHFLRLRVLCTSVTFLLLMHTLEVVLWSGPYFLIPGLSSFDTFEEAVYFSAVTYVALGYGDLVITSSWRLLGGIQAMTGMLMFGWSTAFMIVIIQKILFPNEESKD